METFIKTLFIVLLSLVLLGSPISGRKDPKDYWVDMMKGQPMPEAIKDFINQRSYEGLLKAETIKDFIKEFDPIPNVSVYHDDVNPKEVKSKMADCNDEHDHADSQLSSKKLYADKFEPIPNVSVYND